MRPSTLTILVAALAALVLGANSANAHQHRRSQGPGFTAGVVVGALGATLVAPMQRGHHHQPMYYAPAPPQVYYAPSPPPVAQSGYAGHAESRREWHQRTQTTTCTRIKWAVIDGQRIELGRSPC